MIWCDPAREPVEGDTPWGQCYGVSLFHHPDLLIPDQCRDYAEEYYYVERFGTRIDYTERSARWIEASQYFVKEAAK